MITYTKEVPGRAHERSEDSSLEAILNNSSQKEWGLYMVADGLTAHNGTKASHTALAVIRNYLADNLKKGGGVVKEIIKEAVVLANEKLQDITVSCTTLDLILVSPDNIYLTHLGDSRIYFVYNDSLELMTEDQITSFGAPADYVGSTFVEGDSRPIGERLVVKQYQLSEYNISGIYLETDGVILKEEEKERFLLQIPQGANPKKILDQMATEIQSVKRRQSDIDDVTMLYVDLEDVVERKLQEMQDHIKQLEEKVLHNETEAKSKISTLEQQLGEQNNKYEQLEIQSTQEINSAKQRNNQLEEKHIEETNILIERYKQQELRYAKEIAEYEQKYERLDDEYKLKIGELNERLRFVEEKLQKKYELQQTQEKVEERKDTLTPQKEQTYQTML